MPSKESHSKTSKTARVMNLISKKADPAPAGEAAELSAPVPPIISSIAPDAEVSVQIKNALESELAGEFNVQAPPSQPEVPAPAQPEPQPASVEPAPAAPAVEPVQSEPVQSEPVQSEPPQETAAPLFAEPEAPGYVNVMQILVEEKAPRYIKLFGLCQCKRCLEDVKAITLNNLTPKYVVFAEGERVPRLTLYENRYSCDITAQLMRACEAVAQRPHHER